jgi:hypothetical protein
MSYKPKSIPTQFDPLLERLGEISSWKKPNGEEKIETKTFFVARHLFDRIIKDVPAARPPIFIGASPRGGISMAWTRATALLQLEISSGGKFWLTHSARDVMLEDGVVTEDKIVEIIRDHFFYATGLIMEQEGEMAGVPR